MAALSDSLRYEDAARLRDRISALEQVVRSLAELERMSRACLCLVVPAAEHGYERGFVVAEGRVTATRAFPSGRGALEIDAAVAEASRLPCPESLAPEEAEELMLVASFLRRPPPELRVLPLDRAEARRAA